MGRRDEIIWENVDRIRKQKKLTKKRLADLAGTAPQYLTQLKNGRGFGNDILERLADALDVDVSVLMQGAPEDKKGDKTAELLEKLVDSLTARVKTLEKEIARYQASEDSQWERINKITDALLEYRTSGNRSVLEKLRETGM